MSISGAVRPFPKAGPLNSIGSLSTYIATLGEWLRQNAEMPKGNIPTVNYADLPPLAGNVRFISVPDDPTYGQVICFNGVSTSGTDTGWYRLIPAGTAGGPSATLPAGGTASQVLGKTSTADYAFSWQTPYYVPSATGTSGQGLRKTGAGATNYAWGDLHEVPAGGGSGDVLTKSGTADYALAWATPRYVSTGGTANQALRRTGGTYGWADVNELTTGGTAAQVLAKVDATNYNAAWVTLFGLPAAGTAGQALVKQGTASGDATWSNSLGTTTASALISQGVLEAGTGSFARFSSTAGYIGKALELAGQSIVGTSGTTTQFLALTINGTAGHVPFITA